MHARLAAALRTAIRSGRIGTGAALPPSRTLAATLGCSRWVVTQAYAQLASEGYLTGQAGSGTTVQWAPEPDAVLTRPRRTTRARYDLTPGLPDLRAFPRRRWAEAVRTALATATDADLGYPPSAGHPRLLATLAEYLTRSRGALAHSDTLTVCAGIGDGLQRLYPALTRAGHTAIAVEDPGWGRAQLLADAAGLRVVPVPVDEDGLRVDLIPAGIRAVVVSPAHQFPTGTVLAPARRAALVGWARTVDGLIVEDDYDAEFRYDRRPVGALQGLEPARVVLLGSVSKTLAPAVGIGWAVAPAAWSRALRVRHPPPVLHQLSFAEFLTSGGYDRHLHRCRQRYRARRDMLVAALARCLPEARVHGVAAGLHLLLYLPDRDLSAVVEQAASGGTTLAELAWYRLRPGPSALVLGYGNLTDSAIEPAVRALAAAVADCPSRG
jgi:GntR family transcriptional regulator/MocR family aminotransferase